MLRGLLRAVPAFRSRCFSDEKLRPELVQKLVDLKDDYVDAKTFRIFTYKEMKQAIPNELWEKITKDDPISKYPELLEFMDIEDVLPQNNPRLPPHLTRPAILLNDRQLQAQRMTLEFSKEEYKLKTQRDAEVDAFHSLTTDGYEVNIGLMFTRDPIFMSVNPTDHAFSQVRHKVWSAHSLYYVAEKELTDYEYVEDDDASEEDRRRRAFTLKNLAEGKPYEYVPGSIHYLETNPNEADMHSVQFAPGNRTYLLLKDKITKKWVFPVVPALGNRSARAAKEEILSTILLGQVKAHHSGPLALCCEKKEYGMPRQIQRPKSFDEEVYNLYFDRLKLLFPASAESQIEQYLEYRHQMKRERDPIDREVRGSKTFYFLSSLVKGNITKVGPQYEDWAWVPKAKFSDFLTKEDYQKVIAVATNY